MLPWLSPSSDNSGRPPFNCDQSETDLCGLDHRIKCEFHCGYIDRKEWIGDKPTFPKPFIGDPTDKAAQVDLSELDVCPGWLVRQPGVIQAAEAYGVVKTMGDPSLYYPNKDAIILESIMIATRGYNTHEVYKIRKPGKGS